MPPIASAAARARREAEREGQSVEARVAFDAVRSCLLPSLQGLRSRKSGFASGALAGIDKAVAPNKSRCDQESERDVSESSNDLPPPASAAEAPSGVVTRLSPLTRRLVAGNASPFTFTGTCSYIVGEGEVAIIDPGPADEAHVAALLAAVDGRAGEPYRGHPQPPRPRLGRGDAAGKNRRADRRRARACFLPKAGRRASTRRTTSTTPPTRALADGERIEGRGFTLEAIATPGHAANHLCFALLQENALFSGDHVMAWSTSIVAPPDGSMADYMASLEKLRVRGEAIYWPGHGGPVASRNATCARSPTIGASAKRRSWSGWKRATPRSPKSSPGSTPA